MRWRYGCVRVALLMKRREAGLSEAQRLILEEHLGRCQDCRNDARALDALGDLVDFGAPAPLGASAHERAIVRALAARGAVGAGRVPLSRARARGLVIVLAFAGAAAVMFSLRRPTHAPEDH